MSNVILLLIVVVFVLVILLGLTVSILLVVLRLRYNENKLRHQDTVICKQKETIEELKHNQDTFLLDMDTFILHNLSNPCFTIENLAMMLLMSKPKFYKLFKEHTGGIVTPNQYLIDMKLEKAKELLCQGDNTNKVSELVGFKTTAYFVSLYKKKYGSLPVC